MDWIELAIDTTTEGIEPVSGRLYQLGIKGVQIEDAADFQDFLENSTPYWDYVDDELMQKATAPTRVKAYLTDDAAGAELLAAIKTSLAELQALDTQNIFGSLSIALTGMSEQDWAENWKQYYKPLKIGEKILIKPEWEEIADTGGRTVFEINPGMSFGTGTHESTQLCLESLEQIVKKGDSVVDLGCGSGILSVISLLLGADHATAVDIDPNAAKIARENAARNRVPADKYAVYAGNILTDTALQGNLAAEKYDIVLANIVADVIISLAPQAKRLLRPGGTFITSGIISDRLEEVKEALQRQNFEIVKVSRRNDWAAIVAK